HKSSQRREIRGNESLSSLYISSSSPSLTSFLFLIFITSFLLVNTSLTWKERTTIELVHPSKNHHQHSDDFLRLISLNVCLVCQHNIVNRFPTLVILTPGKTDNLSNMKLEPLINSDQAEEDKKMLIFHFRHQHHRRGKHMKRLECRRLSATPT